MKKLTHDAYLNRIRRIEDALKIKHYKSPELIEFWQGLVRNSSGRWNYFFFKDNKYFRYGKQSKPDPHNHTQIHLIKSSINQQKEFIHGIMVKRYKDFKHWLIQLHKQQAYMGIGGQTLSKRRISEGEHSQIVETAIVPLSKKYNDPYKGTGKRVLYLPGISPEGCPVDEWENTGRVIHYYPDVHYFDQYLHEMRLSFERLICDRNINNTDRLITLANYYQYGANIHIFESVNQSLFMNQVNTLLGLMGFKQIEHGILDFAAMRLQQSNFAKYFIDEVKRVN